MPSDILSKLQGRAGITGPIGPAGPKGDVTTQNNNPNFLPAIIGFIPPNPATNFSGTTLFSANQITSTNFNTNTANITTLNVANNTILGGTDADTVTINANSISLAGTAPILNMTNGAGTLSINTVTNRPVTFGSGLVTIPNITTTLITTPLLIGGTAVGSSLALQSTSAAGTTDFIKFSVGNNGATEAMRILNSGNIGIGTTTPTNILSLGGTSARTIWMERNITAAAAGQGLTLSSGGATLGTADLAGGDLSIKSGISTGLGNSALHFFTATAGLTGTADNTPTEKVIILGNGNVGIGTTAPGANLDIRQATNGLTIISAQRMTDTAPSGDFISYKNAAGNTTLFRVDNSGNLFAGGILNSGSQTITSTSSPQFRVQYDASNENTNSVSVTGVTTYGYNGSTPKAIFTPQSNATNTFQFQNAAATPILTINTTTPGMTLAGNFTQTGANTFSTGTGALSLNGAVSVTGTNTFTMGTGLATFNGHLLVEGVTSTGAVGTGRFVFDNSPTLITPNIGVATGTSLSLGAGAITSGAITSGLINAQTISSSANFTGTVAVATSLTSPLILGGVTASSSISLQSTLGAGTTDFIKFLVGNNGVTEAVRITTAGNVGIGITNPTSRLAVLGNADITNALVSGTPGSATTISTGDISTKGLIIKGNNFFAANTLINNINAYWKFDENTGSTIADSVNSNTLTWNGTLGGQWTTGKINSSGNYNGSDNNTTAVLSSSLKPVRITISLWYNPTSASGTRYLIDTNNDSASFGYNIQTAPTGFYVSLGGVSGDRFSTFTFNTGTWYNIVATYDGTNIITYVNGSQTGTFAIGSTPDIAYSGGTFTIGSANGGGSYVSGKMDEIGIWSRALTPTEITSLYNSGIGIQYTFGAATPQVADLQQWQNGSSSVLSVVDKNGYLGIGTTAPGYPLVVQTNGTGTTINSNIVARFQSTAAGRDASIQLSDNVTNAAFISMTAGDLNFTPGGGSQALSIKSAGNIGIGTTTPAQSLEVKNSGTAGVSTIANFINSAATWTGLQIKTDQSNGFGILSAVANGANAFGLQLNYQNSSGVSTNALTISTTGNVGIGTTAPGANLDVNINNTSYSQSVSAVRISNVTSGQSSLDYYFNNALKGRIRGDGTGNMTYVSTGGSHTFFTGGDSGVGIQVMTLNNSGGLSLGSGVDAGYANIIISGKLGIGTTAAPVDGLSIQDKELTVVNTLGGSSIINFGTSFIGAARYDGRIMYDASIDRMDFVTNSNYNNPDFSIKAGKVGVGTTTPGAKLEVNGGLDAVYNSNILVSSSAATAKIAFNPTSVASSGIGNESAGLVFYTNGANTERMRITSTGNVGIGTTSPAAALTVVKDLATGGGDATGFRLQTASTQTGQVLFGGPSSVDDRSYLQSYKEGTSAGVRQLSLNPLGGNVGIGTTVPGYALDVSGAIKSSGGMGAMGTIPTASVGFKVYSSSASVLRGFDASLSATGVLDKYVVVADAQGATTGTNYALYGSAIGASANNFGLYVANGTSYMSGNVGIGTTGPNYKLEVDDTNKALSSAQANFATLTTDAQAADLGGSIGFGGVYTGTSKTLWGLIKGGKQNGVDADYGGYLALATRTMGTGSPGERMRIDSSGNVGIGTTNPGALLHVSGTTAVGMILENTAGVGSYNNQIVFKANNANRWQIGNDVAAGGTTGNFEFYSPQKAGGAATVLTVTPNGNVGIGATNPAYKFMVQGASGGNGITMVTNSDFVNGSVGSGAYLATGGTSGNTYSQIQAFITGNSAVGNLVLNPSGGNVGIGTTNPGAKLEVSGNIKLNPTNELRYYNVAQNNWTSIDSPLLAGDTLPDFRVRTGSGTLYMNSGGNVGIGLTNPSELLHIKAGATDASLRLENTAASSKVWNLTAGGGGNYSSGVFAIRNVTDAITPISILSTGNVGIMTSGTTDYQFLVGGTLATGTSTQFGIAANPTFASGVTSQGIGIYASPSTAASAFTLSTAYTAYLADWNKGAGSTITNQTGLFVAAQTKGSTLNIGVDINAPTGATTNIGLRVAGGETISSGGLTVTAGNVGIGTAPIVSQALRIQTTLLTGTTQTLFAAGSYSFSSSATTAGINFYGATTTAAAAFTLANGYVFRADTPNVGAGSTITTNTGFRVENQGASGVTNAYGIDIAAQSGAATTNIGLKNASTTYLLGAVGIGGSPTGTQGLNVTGTFITGATSLYGILSQPTFGSGATAAGYAFYSGATTAASSFTMTNFYGMYIDNITKGATSTITNDYGLYVVAPTQGGTVNTAAYFGGNVGIGVTNPSAPLEVKGTGTGATIAKFTDVNTTGCTLATGGTISCSSDVRLKKNIENITYGLSTVMALRPVLFNWNYQNDSTPKNLGFIAQEVEQIIPQLVSTDDNGYKQLNTIAIVPALTKALQELDLKVTALEALSTSSGQANAGSSSAAQSLGAYASAFFSGVVIKVENGVAYMKGLVVDSLKIGSPDKRTGVTFYDEINGAPFCLSIANGVQKVTAGECTIITPAPVAPITSTTPSTGSGSAATPPIIAPATVTSDVIAPVITLIGASSVNITVGGVYTEAGATVTDNVDTSVAVIISGSVDTTAFGVYIIHYNAKDTAGNPAVEVTRTVNVTAVP